MCEFLYDHIENKYGNKSRFLLADTDNLMYEIETKIVMKIFVTKKKLTLVIILLILHKLKYYDDSNALVVGKMKDEMSAASIAQLVRL